MTRSEKIDYIITNSPRFDEKRRQLLNSLSDIDLEGVVKITNREFEDELQEALASY